MKTMNSKPCDDNIQFSFSKANKETVEIILSRYPEGWKISAVLPLLHLAQKQNGGWLSKDAMEHVSVILNVHPMRVYEVASFYTMFHLSFVGKHVVQICRTASCWLNGASQLTELCKKKFDINLNETSSNGLFTIQEVECLGACRNAPVVQINDDYYENLDERSLEKVLDQIVADFVPDYSTNNSNKSSGFNK